MTTSIDRSPQLVGREVRAKNSHGLVQTLLICGIASSWLYGAMIWVIHLPDR